MVNTSTSDKATPTDTTAIPLVDLIGHAKSQTIGYFEDDEGENRHPDKPFSLPGEDADVGEYEQNSDHDKDAVVEFARWRGMDLVAQYWGRTREIPAEAFAKLLTRYATVIHGVADAGACALISRRNGVYNSGYILRFDNNTKVVVRVPACGWTKRWNEKDQKLLQSTALAMRYIGSKTAVPLPTIFGYDTTLDNEIGAPFILMSFLEGYSARQAWSSNDWDVPKETRRQNLLRSLANAISGLSVLTFPSAGSLWFDHGRDGEPTIGESWNLRVEGFVIKRVFEHFDPYASTRRKAMSDLQQFLEEEGFPSDCHDPLINTDIGSEVKSSKNSMEGMVGLYKLMIETFLDAVNVPEAGEEYVLAHSDYDIQNLLVDHEGNVTGILDWDGVAAAPRQIGWSMLPFWLQRDWNSGYPWPPAEGVDYVMMCPDEFEGYRQDFARYMYEACNGTSDCMYTSKSHIYRALMNSMGNRYDAASFVRNVLAEVLPRSGGMAYCNQVGQFGFREGEREWLERRLRKFFKPSTPVGVEVDLGGEDSPPRHVQGAEPSGRRWYQVWLWAATGVVQLLCLLAGMVLAVLYAEALRFFLLGFREQA